LVAKVTADDEVREMCVAKIWPLKVKNSMLGIRAISRAKPPMQKRLTAQKNLKNLSKAGICWHPSDVSADMLTPNFCAKCDFDRAGPECSESRSG